MHESDVWALFVKISFLIEVKFLFASRPKTLKPNIGCKLLRVRSRCVRFPTQPMRRRSAGYVHLDLRFRSGLLSRAKRSVRNLAVRRRVACSLSALRSWIRLVPEPLSSIRSVAIGVSYGVAIRHVRGRDSRRVHAITSRVPGPNAGLW